MICVFFNKICKSNKIQLERYSLLSLSLLFLLLDKKYYNDYTFVSLVSFFSSLIIFGNFPVFVTWNSAKPIYYEDLYIDVQKLPEYPLPDNKKELYFLVYTRALIVSSSILISVLTCYWKFKTENSTFVEIAGITGGLLQIASIINIINGRLILYCIKHFISIQVGFEDSQENISDEDKGQNIFCEHKSDEVDVENSISTLSEFSQIPLD